MESFIFNNRVQEVHESFDVFYTYLRKLVKSCEFGNQCHEKLNCFGNLCLQESLIVSGRAAELSGKQAQTVQN